MLSFVAIVFLAFTTVQAKVHPYSQEFVQELHTKFFDGNDPSLSKISVHEKRVEKKIAEISSLIGDVEKAQKADSVVALARCARLLQKMKASDRDEVLRLGAEFLEVENAVRIEGDAVAWRTGIEQGRNFLKRWTLPFHSRPDEEATDLYDSESGKFLTPETFNGRDLSVVDPDPRTPFWKKPGTSQLYQGEDISFPDDGVALDFDEVKYSDTKPKMNVFFKDENGKKKKFKLKFAAEIHADPTLSTLQRKLGFEADVTKYVKNVRVNLGRKYTIKDLSRDIEIYYRRDHPKLDYRIETFVKEHGRDKNGEFVVFKEAILEAKPKGVTRAGGWSFKEQGHADLRSVRGLLMVQLWLDNSDMKEFGNNQVLLKGDDTYLVISDLGKGLGNFIGEKPELYTSQMVSKRSNKGLTFTFRQWATVGIKNKMTLADARWAGRLIATLTRADIEEGVRAGGWPLCIQKIYNEKILSRRNDLLKHLGLIGQNDRNGNIISEIPTSQETDFHKVCKPEDLEEATLDFDWNAGVVAKPAFRAAFNGLTDLAVNAIGQTKHITLSGAEIGFESGVISQVILNLRREIETNPKPKSADELYIIRDHFEVGMRLGYSFGLYKDYTYSRAFTMSYPVRTKAEARWKNGFIVNVLLPKNIKDGNLPEKYVLHTDHFFERGYGVDLDNMTEPVALTVRLRASKARIMRTVLDHRNKDRVVVYRDRTHYAEVLMRTFARLILVKLPLMTTYNRWGNSSGAGSVLTKEEFQSVDIHKIVANGDFSDHFHREKRFHLHNNFLEQDLNWNLVFLRGRNTGRFERIHLEHDGVSDEFMQYRTSRMNSWNFINGSENRTTAVQVLAEKGDGNFQLKVTNVVVDTNTRDDELENDYLRFVNNLSPDGKPIISFTPSLGYSTNKKWGVMETRSETTYFREGITAILGLSDDHLFNNLALQLKLTRPELNDLFSRVKEAKEEMNSSSVSSRSAVLRAYGLTEEDMDLVAGVETFRKGLKDLRKEKAIVVQLKKLGSLFRKMSMGIKDSRILGTMNRIVGQENFHTINVISPPQFKEMNTIEGLALVGESGKARPDQAGYLNYVPATALELWNIFENWRVHP
ncbi:MAG: hypothetical protein V4598_08190 [Bdellovibrionota bacterium]